MKRFTLDGSDALEQRIVNDCLAVATALVEGIGADQLDALILGGGYGRGEGGVLAGDRPFNDYDLVLVHHVTDRRQLGHHLAQVQRTARAATGIHVDITPLPRSRLARLPAALTWFELAHGHCVIWGDPATLAPLRDRTLAGVDASEWGRLLLNRAFGVVLAQRRRAGALVSIGNDESETPFCLRQVMKAWLALGDVWLADRGAYAPSVVARRTAMLALSEPPTWVDRWLEAVEFKLKPVMTESWPGLDAEVECLAGLLAPALAGRAVAQEQPLVGCWDTLRHLPVTAWWPPWRYPRERLRRYVVSALSGAHVDWPRCERLWAAYG
jgi:hypothetical protein